MKKKFLAMLANKEARKKELFDKSQTTEVVAELRSYNAEIEILNGEIAELRGIIDSMPDEDTEQRVGVITPQGAFNPLGAFGTSPQSTITDEKRGLDAIIAMPVTNEAEKGEMRNALFALPEYRSGYLKFLSGRTRENLTDAEQRALTIATDSGGAAVPTTTYEMIIKRLTQISVLFPLVRQTYIPGNVSLPVADPQNAATWTDTYTADADDTLSQVLLGSYALSKFAKVKGQLLLMAIDAFESYVVEAISDQLAIAVENAILNGTGSSQPTGILNGVTWGTGNSATYSKTNGVGYDDLVGARALLGLYRSNAYWVMNATMEAQIFKIKTTQGQPLFTQNPITGLISDPLGFPIKVDYYMPDDTILLGNFDYYYMNINQNPTILSDDSAGFLSTSRLYRGTMFLDSKPARSEAFVKLTKSAT